MNYWRGRMDWPIAADWACQTCHQNGTLTWGLVNGECRCDFCHTQYSMRGKDGKEVEAPICNLKPEYMAPAEAGYRTFDKPISEWSDLEWDKAIELASSTAARAAPRSDKMNGQRNPDQHGGDQHGWKPGEYGRIDGQWWIRPPRGGLGSLENHTVVEHEDGTITVSPSILLDRSDGTVIWHGYLEHGVWREV